MRLLIVTQTVDLDSPVLGFFHQWIAKFAKHCDEVLVICLKEGRRELPSNVRVLSLGKEIKRSRLSYVWRFYHYIYAYRKEYDAVFVHMNPEYVVLAGIFWRQWGKRVALWYVHKSVTWWLRVASILVDAICTVSTESIRLQNRKIHAMGHGIDLSLFVPAPHAKLDWLRILTVGRIAASKGLLEVLEALDVLASRHVNFYWSIAGAPGTSAEEAYAMELKREVSKRSFSDRVTFLGAVAHHDLPAVLAKSDVLVNISTTGGYDKVVLEAIAAGVPALSSSEPFKPLLFSQGFFIDSTDPQTIADALVRGACTPIAIEQLRAKVLESHSLEALIPRILRILA